MVSTNYAARELTCKIAYWGPPFAGKRTNFEQLLERAPSAARARPAFTAGAPFCFDLGPVQLGARQVEFQLWTISSQVILDQNKGQLLRDVDGLVFVADSQDGRMDANREALEELRAEFEARGRDLAALPFVLQLNKRDAPTALPVEVVTQMLQAEELRVIEAVATRGQGVVETWTACRDLVLEALKPEHGRSP